MWIFTFLHIEIWTTYETVPQANEELQMFLFSVPEEKREKKSWMDGGICNDGFAAGGRASTEALRITTVEQTEKKKILDAMDHGFHGQQEGRGLDSTGGQRENSQPQ